MFDGMIKSKKLEHAKKLFSDSISADIKWQSEAKEDFLFRDGHQWTAQEKRILSDEQRPILTFNLTKANIDLIMGMNEDNKVVFRCAPVDPTDGFLCEVLNDLTYWVSENNRFSDEDETALESGAICGRGYVAVDFMPDPKRFGDIIMTEVAIPVHEVHFDPAARRKDLSDASSIFWDRWLPLHDFKIKYPNISKNKIEDILSAAGQNLGNGWSAQPAYAAEYMDYATPISHGSDTSDYNRPMDHEFFDKRSNMIRVVHMEYWEPYKRIYLFLPRERTWQEITGQRIKEVEAAFKEAYPDAEFVTETMMDKKVKWLQFTGNEILFDDDSPLPFPGFSICPLFVFTDASKRTANHFGIVRLMKDPQREINKRWSQALNMLNQQVQPGVWAETDAFVDMKQAEVSMKEAGSITWINPGALNKIKERTVPRFPDAPMQMEQFSQDIIKKITGINPDLLGQDRGRQEPGVVVRLRQQQGLTLLKPLFKSYNNMKKDLFVRQLSIIMEYMPDQQILRILGSGDRYDIDPTTGIITDKLTKMQANVREVKNIQYNVIAEESEGNMTKRMLELTALMEMQKGGFPVDPLQIIEKMHIPESDKQRWIQYIQQQQQAQQEAMSQETKFAMEQAAAQLSLEDKKIVMNFLVSIAKLKQMAEKDEKKVVMEERKMQNDIMKDVLALAKSETAKQQGGSDGSTKPKEQKVS